MPEEPKAAKVNLLDVMRDMKPVDQIEQFPDVDETLLPADDIDLAEIISAVTPDNVHEEIDFGSPRGKEK